MERVARAVVGIENADGQVQFAAHDAHGFEQIGIIGDEHGDFIIAFVAVVNEMNREIDIRAFLFRFDDFDELRLIANAPGERHNTLLGKKVAKDNF